MITEIFDENLSFFKPFIPSFALERTVMKEVLFLGCVEGEIACGAIVVDYSGEEGEAELLSLYVAPEYRGRGFGGELLNKALEVLHFTDAWQLSCVYSLEEMNERLLESFLQRNGFDIERKESSIYHMNLAELPEMLVRGDENYGGKGIRRMDSLSNISLRDFNSRVAAKSHVFRQDIKENSFDKDISAFLVEEDKIAGCILLSSYQEKDLQLETAYYEGKDTSALYRMLRASTLAIMKKYGTNTNVWIPCVDKSTAKLIEALTDKRASKSRDFKYAYKIIL